MTIPSVHNWLAGDEWNADRLNEVGTAISFLRNPPFVRVGRRLTTQSVPTNTYTAISFDTVFNSYDPYDMFDAGTPTRVTIKEPGWYSCEGFLSLSATATDTRALLGIFKNGSNPPTDMLLRFDQGTLPNTGNTNIRKETTLFLNAGDFLSLFALCDGATLTSQITSDAEHSGMRVRWVSN